MFEPIPCDRDMYSRNSILGRAKLVMFPFSSAFVSLNKMSFILTISSSYFIYFAMLSRDSSAVTHLCKK